MKKKMSIVDYLGIAIAIIILLFIVVPGVIGIGIRMLIELLYLGVYLVIGFVMIKIIDICLKQPEVK